MVICHEIFPPLSLAERRSLLHNTTSAALPYVVSLQLFFRHFSPLMRHKIQLKESYKLSHCCIGKNQKHYFDGALPVLISKLEMLQDNIQSALKIVIFLYRFSCIILCCQKNRSERSSLSNQRPDNFI